MNADANHAAPDKALADMSEWSRDAIAELFARIALAAGPIVMSEYAKGCEVRTKGDSSPVTVADEKAEELILALLRARHCTVPVIAEEAMARGDRTAVGDSFILVDPLDGTREFIA
jgi:3'(2'), 5'-bisphosphate nucleotidase